VSEIGDVRIRGISLKGVKKHGTIVMSLRVYHHTKVNKIEQFLKEDIMIYESTGAHF
jgi:hypothetical protein